jgi:hypothetical protein
MPVITYTWIDGTTGDWGTASDWSGGVVPDGTSNAAIAGAGTETVTVSANQAVNLLTLNDANATLAVINGVVDTAVHVPNRSTLAKARRTASFERRRLL